MQRLLFATKRLHAFSTGLSLAAVLLALTTGCGSDPDPAEDTGDGNTDVDAGELPDGPPPGRSFLLGGWAESYDLTQARPWTPNLEPVADELAEAVLVPLDTLGIPWESFTGPDNVPADLPGPWLAEVQAIRALAESAGKHIALRLSPLSTNFDTLAADAREDNGALALNETWKSYCYDPSSDGNPTKYRDAYAGFAAWAVQQFEPRWVVLGHRMNLYEDNCGTSPFDALVGFTVEANARVKALDAAPLTVVGVDVEDLYGLPPKAGRCVAVTPADCLAERRTLLAGIDADVLGLESYPAPYAADFATGDQLPADWLTAVADARADMTAGVLGTSLPAQSMRSQQGVCVGWIDSSEDAQRLWLDNVLNAADTRDMSFVFWRSLVDLLEADVVATCPCSGDAATCNHLDQLGARADDVRVLVGAGLVGLDGTERPAVQQWRTTLGE